MKTVTIPTCANPFVVIINGKKYTYPAGATMEVPDEVAEVIERHSEAKPQSDPNEKMGSVMWNDIVDQPFGEKVIMSDTLAWDGTPSDTMVDLGGAAYHHLSGYVPTEEELAGAIVSVEVQGTVVNHTVRVTDIASLDQNVFGVIVPGSGSNFPVIVICRADNYTCLFQGMEIYIKNKGINFMDMQGFVTVKALTIPGENKFPYTEVTPLDAKYSPELINCDLREIGLPAVDYTSPNTHFKTVNTVALRRALDKGPARFIFELVADNETFLCSAIATACLVLRQKTGVSYYRVAIPIDVAGLGTLIIHIEVTSTSIQVHGRRLQYQS